MKSTAQIVKTGTPFTAKANDGKAYVATNVTYSDGTSAIIPFSSVKYSNGSFVFVK